MIKLQISAPGKVILFGEHAVVYGKTAVAASLNLRTIIKFAELPKSPYEQECIVIEFPGVNLFLNFPLIVLRNHFFSNNFNNEFINKSDQLHSLVKDFVNSNEHILEKRDDDEFSKQKLSLQAFFYLLVLIAHKEHINIKETSYHVCVNTELNVGTGIGSSASFAVCLAACFLHWSLLQKGDHDTFSKDELDKISMYALDCETIMHESPSGIDNSVCTYGSVIKFENKELVEMLPHLSNLKILLVNSNIIRSTKEQVKRVVHLKGLYPSIIVPVLDSIDALSKSGWEIIKEMSSNSDDFTRSMAQNWYTALSTLIHMNQGLLNALDVSHPKLEMICAMAWLHSYAGKLTGAGGGGYVYVLLPPDTGDISIQQFSKQLEEKGFQVLNTSLGVNGVRIEPFV